MSLFFTKFYLSHKYMTLFLYMVLKHKVHKALINIIQLLCRSVNDKKRAAKGRPYKFFQNHYRSYSVMRFKSFIFIHIFIGDMHYIVEPEIFYRSNGCAHAY